MAQTIRRFATITLANGEKRRISARGKTEREALKNLAEMKAGYELGIVTLNSNTPLSVWVGTWLTTYKKPAVTCKTYKQMQQMLDKYFLSSLGSFKISAITRAQIQGCINEMQGKSENYIKKAVIYIKAVFAAAQEEGIINQLPTRKLTIPKGKKLIRRSLTPEEKNLFLECLPKHPHGAYFGMMYACGLRPGETRALTYDCIDFKNKTVTVKQAVESGATNIKAPKSESGNRTIPLPDWYIAILRSRPRNINGYVFNTAAGKMLSEQANQRAWHGFMRTMNIAAGATLYRNQIVEHKISQELTPYYLRHTYATELAEKGVDIKTAQYLLGHSDITLTANIYTHVTSHMLEDARAKINTAPYRHHNI